MGMQKKLQRQYNNGYMQGCNDTWDLVEQAINRVDGIGPKLQKRLMDAIVNMAKEEATKERGK